MDRFLKIFIILTLCTSLLAPCLLTENRSKAMVLAPSTLLEASSSDLYFSRLSLYLYFKTYHIRDLTELIHHLPTKVKNKIKNFTFENKWLDRKDIEELIALGYIKSLNELFPNFFNHQHLTSFIKFLKKHQMEELLYLYRDELNIPPSILVRDKTSSLKEIESLKKEVVDQIFTRLKNGIDFDTYLTLAFFPKSHLYELIILLKGISSSIKELGIKVESFKALYMIACDLKDERLKKLAFSKLLMLKNIGVLKEERVNSLLQDPLFHKYLYKNNDLEAILEMALEITKKINKVENKVLYSHQLYLLLAHFKKDELLLTLYFENKKIINDDSNENEKLKKILAITVAKNKKYILAEEIIKTIYDPSIRAKAYTDIGFYFAEQKEDIVSLTFFDKGFEEVLLIENNQEKQFQRLKEIALKSTSNHMDSYFLKFLDQIKDPARKTILAAKIGVEYSKQGKFKKAKIYFNQALNYVETIPSTEEKLPTLETCSKILIQEGFTKEAATFLFIGQSIAWEQKYYDLHTKEYRSMPAERRVNLKRFILLFIEINYLDTAIELLGKIDKKYLEYSFSSTILKKMTETQHPYPAYEKIWSKIKNEQEKLKAVIQIAETLLKSNQLELAKKMTYLAKYSWKKMKKKERPNCVLRNIMLLLASSDQFEEAIDVALKASFYNFSQFHLPAIASIILQRKGIKTLKEILTQLPITKIKKHYRYLPVNFKNIALQRMVEHLIDEENYLEAKELAQLISSERMKQIVLDEITRKNRLQKNSTPIIAVKHKTAAKREKTSLTIEKIRSVRTSLLELLKDQTFYSPPSIQEENFNLIDLSV